MKLTLSRYLTEAGGRPAISKIRANLKACIDKGCFIFRGSENGNNFGQKDKRTSRSSQTNSNLFLNFTNVFFPELPSRKSSYFASSDASEASTFGDIYVLFPHDSIKTFALIEDDFNLRPNPVLKEISSTASDYAGFGYAFWLSTIEVSQLAKVRLEDPHAAEMLEVAKKINKNIDVSKSDFDDFDRVFKAVMSNKDMKSLEHLITDIDRKICFFVWEIVSSKYDGVFSKFLHHVVEEGNKEIHVMGFAEALDFIKTHEKHGRSFEIWFEGGCSYFSVDWISRRLGKEMDDEDFNIADESSDMQDYADYIADFLSRYIKEA